MSILAAYMNLYALLVIFVPCFIYLLLKRKCHHYANFSHYLLVAVFLLYLFLLLRVTGVGTLWDIGHYDRVIHWNAINFIPFQSQGFRTYVLNVLLFVPMGVLLPLLSQAYHRFSTTLKSGFFCSLAVELCQLLNLRCSDVDDLLMNTLGTVIGFGLWFVVSRLFKREYFPSAVISLKEPRIYMLLSFLGTFFLYSPWLFWQ